MIRPGCRFRVIDDNTGMPVPDEDNGCHGLCDAKDTIGRWEFTTDELGEAAMSTVRETRTSARQRLARKPGSYSFAALQAPGYAMLFPAHIQPHNRRPAHPRVPGCLSLPQLPT